MIKSKLKNVIYIALVCFIIFFFISCAKKEREPAKAESAPEQIIAEIKFPSPETVIGKVGDFTIDFKTAEEKLLQSIAQSEKVLSPEQFKLYKKQIINEYLKVWGELKLFTIAADKKGITVDKNDIDDVMNYFKVQTPPSITTEEYLKTLAFEQNDIQAIAKAQKYVLQQVPVDLSDESLKKFYEENKNIIIRPEKINLFALVIDISTQDTNDQKKEKKQKAEEALKKLKSGEDFSKIAKEYSTDTTLVMTGGDMGYMDTASLSEPFLSVFKKLKIGEHSNVIETQNGYWIIKVNQVISTYGDNFERDKNYIKRIAEISHYNKNKQKLMSELIKEIPFDINPDGIGNSQSQKDDTKVISPIPESSEQKSSADK